MSHKPGGRLPLLSARPAVTPATLKRAATSFAAGKRAVKRVCVCVCVCARVCVTGGAYAPYATCMATTCCVMSRGGG